MKTMVMKASWEDQLLAECNGILNAYQDIEDAFMEINKYDQNQLDSKTRARLTLIKMCNEQIGSLIVKILPG